MIRDLLDTNHISAAVHPVSRFRKRIHQAHRAGHRFGTCIPVLCELEVGILQVQRPHSYRHQLDKLLEEVRVWPIEKEAVRLFGEISLDLRHRGRAWSHVDIALAALALAMNATLLATDRDFETLPQLRTDNWLTPP